MKRTLALMLLVLAAPAAHARSTCQPADITGDGPALLPGLGPAQALEVVTSDGGTNATGILGLMVGHTLHDVTFEQGTAEGIYGPAPGVFDFTTAVMAKDAVQAVNAALNSEPSVSSVGPPGSGSAIYNVGFDSDLVGSATLALVQEGLYSDGIDSWLEVGDADVVPYVGTTTYADFEAVAAPVPSLAPAGSFLLALGLAGTAASALWKRPTLFPRRLVEAVPAFGRGRAGHTSVAGPGPCEPGRCRPLAAARGGLLHGADAMKRTAILILAFPYRVSL